MTETYDFVQGAVFNDNQNLKLNVRSTLLSDIKSERSSQSITNTSIKACAGFFAVCFLGLSFFLPLMFILFILSLLVLLNASQNADENTEINIYFNKDSKLIEYIDHLSHKKITIFNPQKIKIAARLYSEKYRLIHLSVDIVGFLESDETKQLSNIRLVSYRYLTLDNAKSRVNIAALEFKFLGDWLQLPILAETDAYYYDTNCKVY